MKKLCIIFLLSIIISVTALGFGGCFKAQTAQTDEYLRIHIRAHSNADEAQQVKYLVRDQVVEYLTPFIAGWQDKDSAINGLKTLVDDVARVADGVLLQNGFYYGATARVCKEQFPERVYEDYTLPAGEYDALIIHLGAGAGDNWWCVAYPPLCFASTPNTNIVYKSKIVEIINRWRNH